MLPRSRPCGLILIFSVALRGPCSYQSTGEAKTSPDQSSTNARTLFGNTLGRTYRILAFVYEIVRRTWEAETSKRGSKHVSLYDEQMSCGGEL